MKLFMLQKYSFMLLVVHKPSGNLQMKKKKKKLANDPNSFSLKEKSMFCLYKGTLQSLIR